MGADPSFAQQVGARLSSMPTIASSGTSGESHLTSGHSSNHPLMQETIFKSFSGDVVKDLENINPTSGGLAASSPLALAGQLPKASLMPAQILSNLSIGGGGMNVASLGLGASLLSKKAPGMFGDFSAKGGQGK